MKYRIMGTTMPSLEILLMQNESVITESGGMAWYRGGVNMETNMPGGLMGGLGRALSGESLFMTTYTATSQQAEVTFTLEWPGSIITRELTAGQSLIAQRDAFMVAQDSVKLETYFQKRLGAGLFGGEGFILQRVSGPGVAFFEVDGEVKEVTLAAGEKIVVDPGHIAMYEDTVSQDIQSVKGVKNVLFSGEGLFLATLTGPGTVWLQTMPFNNVMAKILARVPKSS